MSELIAKRMSFRISLAHRESEVQRARFNCQSAVQYTRFANQIASRFGAPQHAASPPPSLREWRPS